MTRDQALQEWYDARRMVEQLNDKINNLKKIIFSEQMVPEAINRYPLNKVTIRSKTYNRANLGSTQAKIVQALEQHGGELMSKDLAVLCEITQDNAGVTCRRLVKLNLINKRIIGSGVHRHAYYSLAIHRDKSELNHE
jgi:DNA-binding MarR family transcriptional regulator